MIFTAAVIQYQVQANNQQGNMQKAEALLQAAAQAGADLLLLPEMFNTSFNLDDIERKAQTSSGEAVAMLSQVAKANQVYIIGGSIIERHKRGGYYNTCFVIDQQGEIIAKYRKVHLFPKSIPAEAEVLLPGDEISMFEFKKDGQAVKVGIGICFDLRFPEQFRNMALRGATVFALPNAWPASRRQQLISLCEARACENSCHLLMANATAPQGGIYCGDSMILSPLGERLVYAGSEEGYFCAEIDTEYSQKRGWLNTLEGRRPFIDEIDNNLL